MKLKIGDTVLSKHGTAVVESIELVEPGQKYGIKVNEVYWSMIDSVVVDMDNGHWSYGEDLSSFEDDEDDGQPSWEQEWEDFGEVYDDECHVL